MATARKRTKKVTVVGVRRANRVRLNKTRATAKRMVKRTQSANRKRVATAAKR